MGECTKEMAFDLFDTFYDLGGNFIDTANTYQSGESEKWIGEWIQKTGRRSELVLATKYTMSPMSGQPVQQSNYGGTGAKSLHVSIQNSLKALQTDYVDIVCAKFKTSSKRIVYLILFKSLRTLLGLRDRDSRADALSECSYQPRQSPVPRHQ